MQIKGHRAVGDIIEAVRKLLARFADADKGDRLPGMDRETGVAVLYSRKRNGVIRFAFVTRDDFLIAVDYDINRTSKQYIDDLVHDVIHRIQTQRERERQILVPNIGAVGW